MKTQLSNLTLLVILSSLVLFNSCRNKKDEEIIALKKAINDVKIENLDSLSDLSEYNITDRDVISLYELTKVLSLTSGTTKAKIEEMLKKQRLNKFIDGEPTTDEELATIFSSRDTNETEYIYYFKEDFEKLLSVGNCPQDSQRGIRIYLATVDSNHRLPSDQSKFHPFAGKRTVYLQSMCGNEKIVATKEIQSLYDFGDVCPPNCNNTDHKGERTPDQIRDGAPPR